MTSIKYLRITDKNGKELYSGERNLSDWQEILGTLPRNYEYKLISSTIFTEDDIIVLAEQLVAKHLNFPESKSTEIIQMPFSLLEKIVDMARQPGS